MPVSHRSKHTSLTRSAASGPPCADGQVSDAQGFVEHPREDRQPLTDGQLGNNQVFADAARAVFQTMLGVPMQVHDYQTATQMSGKGLAVLIALNGVNAGTLIVCISQDAARKFVATLTGLDPSEISESVMIDGVCELVNMIAGAAKASLDDTVMHFDMTLPVSFLSENVCVGVKAGMPGGVLHCGWASETFQLGIWRVKDM